jgi:hypothetical protein
MVEMKKRFRCKDTSRGSKMFLYRAIPLIAVTWGCETWALKKEDDAGGVPPWSN